MNESPFSLDFNEEEESFDLKDVLFKYLRYWPWFLGATILCMALGYAYMRYAPITYQSVAKIKIIDDSKELNVASDALAFMGGSSINLENEIEVLKSYRLLRQVVTDQIWMLGIMRWEILLPTQIYDPPFVVTKRSRR